MPSLRDRQFFGESYPSSATFLPDPGTAYIRGSSAEPRAAHAETWTRDSSNIKSILVTESSAYGFRADADSVDSEYSVRSAKHLDDFWRNVSDRTTYLDITGISHHIWAPLLRSGLRNLRDLRLVYVEPEHYKFSVTPTEGEIFDLSEKIRGVAPLPGFATFGDAAEENVCFVPLLGFEGIRLAHILEQVQPPGGKIVPIIGVPGFKAEYPFHSYHGNHRSLLDSRAWKNLRFAAANDPFGLFFALQDISALFSRDLLKIAPIGTKPHAIGAILYTLASPKRVEIVYDHPIRRPDRTIGTGRVFVYDVSTFMRA